MGPDPPAYGSIQYYLIDASAELAKEQGPCADFIETKYYKGLLPIDHYKKEVDAVAAPEYNLDWEALRTKVQQFGLRN